jgi:outer membrane protein assembly factor BamB
MRIKLPLAFPARHLIGVGLLTLALTACASGVTPAPTPQVTTTLPAISGDDWPMYHRDLARTGYSSATPDPRALTRAWSVALDGSVYAQPLVVAGKVIVATENDSLYALDARTGQVLWRTNVGTPVQGSDLPCGNISPLGITGTPVYDPANKLIFAVAEVSGPSHVLIGLDLDSGAVKVRRSADPPGADPRTHQQRAALALSRGLVYVAYGGLYGDCGSYHGWVVALRTDGQGNLLTYQVPTSREGGIWASPGPIVDANGDLYVSVGNGEATGGAWDHSDSILRLTPQLKLADAFAPATWAQENARDLDLGSLGPVLLPGGWLLAAGKAGDGYLLRAGALGGVGGQAQKFALCQAYGGAATLGNRAYIPCTEGLREVSVGSGPPVTLGWRAPAQVTGSPVIGGHTVYSLASDGTLYALDADTGVTRASIPIGGVTRFATPALAGNALYIGTLTGITAIGFA